MSQRKIIIRPSAGFFYPGDSSTIISLDFTFREIYYKEKLRLESGTRLVNLNSQAPARKNNRKVPESPCVAISVKDGKSELGRVVRARSFFLAGV